MKIRIASIFMAMVLLLTVVLPVGVSAAYENTYKNTGDQRADIIGVALTQVGYAEESGGYTKYGQWYGRPREDWCGIFISWCAEQAGVPTSVLRKTGLANPNAFGFSTYYISSQYTPRPGDLFFSKSFSHAGIVYYVDGDYFYTLEGNTWLSGTPHCVMTRKRVLSDYYFVSPNYNGSGGSLPTSCSHSWKDDSIIKEPGCTSSGSQYQVCEKCGGKRTVTVSAKGHSFGDWTEKDEQLHQRTCANCKKIETKEHDEMQWQTDSAGHWKECETCKGQFQIEPHSYAGACGSKCTVCGYASQDGHNYGPWQWDDSGHWQTCTACNQETERKSHNYPAECAENCADCGYHRVSSHSFVQRSDETGHWEECVVCGKEDNKADHIPGPEASEKTPQLCTECGYELAPKLPHIHEYTYSANRFTHWGQCACGGVAETESHRWSMEESSCSVCGAVAEETKEPFNWDIAWITAGVVIFAGMVLWIVLAACKKKKKH